jgi:hypothetical protein
MRAVAAAALLALAWPAAAQAADYGGGSARSRATLVTVRTKANGAATVRVVVQASCGVARVARQVTPAADGSFAFTATKRTRSGPGIRKVARVAVTGSLVGVVGSGTADAKVQFRRSGQVVERCTSPAHPWQARAAVAEAVSGPPVAGGGYQGITSQNTGQPRAFLLRVDPAGRRVATTVFQYRHQCDGPDFERDNITPGGPIAADGTFHLRERFTLRYANGTERFRVKVDGQFTPAGVSGTLSVRSVFRDGGASSACTTGRVTFAGAL